MKECFVLFPNAKCNLYLHNFQIHMKNVTHLGNIDARINSAYTYPLILLMKSDK